MTKVEATDLLSHVEFEMILRDRDVKVKADLSVVPRGDGSAIEVDVETFDANTDEQVVMNLTREEMASVCRRAAEECRRQKHASK